MSDHMLSIEEIQAEASASLTRSQERRAARRRRRWWMMVAGLLVFEIAFLALVIYLFVLNP